MKTENMLHCVWRAYDRTYWCMQLPRIMRKHDLDRKIYLLMRWLEQSTHMHLHMTILFLWIMSRLGHFKLIAFCDEFYLLDQFMENGEWYERLTWWLVGNGISVHTYPYPHRVIKEAIVLDISARHAQFESPPTSKGDIYITKGYNYDFQND